MVPDRQRGDAKEQDMRRILLIAVSAGAVVLCCGAAAGASSKWTIQKTPDLPGYFSELNGISCASATSCIAVGEGIGQVLLAERWNGSTWALQKVPLPPGGSNLSLQSVACVNPAACMAVGFYTRRGMGAPLAEQWNGVKWAPQATPIPSGESGIGSYALTVSCISPTNCTMAGGYPTSSGATVTLVEHWNGRRWAIQPTPNPSGATESVLSGISCTSAANCTATGWYEKPNIGTDLTLAEHWNGRRWEIQPTPDLPGSARNGGDLFAVSCISATNCIAAGDNSSKATVELPLAERWNGRKWRIQSAAVPSPAANTAFLGISCTSASNCTAVGTYQKGLFTRNLPLIEHWDGRAWALQASPSPPRQVLLVGVSCLPTAECTAVGFYGHQLHQRTLAEHN
jgi:hypothetical protein